MSGKADLQSPKSELAAALSACRGTFVAIAAFSAILNILALTGSLFMLEVYDRVLPSRSVPTLVGLLALVVAVYVFQGLLDGIRGRLLVRIGLRLDNALSRRIHESLVRLPMEAPNSGEGIHPVRDLDAVRGYLSGPGPTALFDLPWLPLYLAICFAFHVWIGVTVLVGALALVTLTLVAEARSRSAVREMTQSNAERTRLADMTRRCAETVQALGMSGAMSARWAAVNESHLARQADLNDLTGGFGSAGRVMRMLLQSVVLAVGAYLVIQQQATAGIIIASSILSARALAPVDLAIAQWKGFVAARQAKVRLDKLLSILKARPMPTPLPAPGKVLTVDNVSVAPPDAQRVVVQDVSFALKAGSGLGIIGPSASGKSSLARLLVGIWRPARGTVRLDGAAFDQWTSDALGRHLGYLPQNVELIEGTVAENISRFASDAKPADVIEAATAAGVHELIVGLPQGYDTPVGAQGHRLSAGQQQRIALARALFGNPFLVVLDEPNSNLDAEGDEALSRAILAVRARGGIVAVVAHRPSALAGVDHVLALADGRQHAFGPKDEVLAKIIQRPAPQQPPRKMFVPAVAG
jgi:ATP-binding cassette subfamily C protein